VDRLSSRSNQITGYIIAGGRSRRFGADKRVIEIDGQTLLDRTQRLVREATGTAPYVVGDNLDGLTSVPSRVLRDAAPGRGPLGGIVAALRHSPTPWCLVLAADLPRLQASDLAALINGSTDASDIITLSVSGEPQPLAAMYHKRTHGFWERKLTDNSLSLIDGIHRLTWKPVCPVSGPDALDNLNTPADLDSMRER
jgi:molybdopterin-guanine dinucleotide biosynthesis protein A